MKTRLAFLQAFVQLNRATVVIVDVSELLRLCSYPCIKKIIHKREEERKARKKWQKEEMKKNKKKIHGRVQCKAISSVVSDSFQLAIE